MQCDMLREAKQLQWKDSFEDKNYFLNLKLNTVK